jgi:hypothetical protein
VPNSLDDWLSICDELLPARLAVMLIGSGIALVPVYFAEKKPLALYGGHEVARLSHLSRSPREWIA